MPVANNVHIALRGKTITQLRILASVFGPGGHEPR